MSKQESADAAALARARHYMGDFAWPTVLLALATFFGYLATVALAVTGTLSLWLATPMIAGLTYCAYTVVHESVHGCISGSHPRLRWVNEALGYGAAWIMMIPLTAHRHEHLAHHRHTNEPEQDPDYHVAQMRQSPRAALAAALQLLKGQYQYYLRHRWSKGPLRQNVYLCLEVAAAILPRVALVLAGYWLEAFALFVVGWSLGIVLLLYLFAYIVHRPHNKVGRYVDTSTILLPGPLQQWLTVAWGYQNYHSIHHLFPRVPFYRYADLYADIEPIMLAQGAPVYRLTLRGLVENGGGQSGQPA